VTAASLRADALYRIQRYEEAGNACETALLAAQRADSDSLASRLAAAIPICYYRHADSLATQGKTEPTALALRFEEIAVRWPDYEHASLAQYRAGVIRLEAGKVEDGVAALETLIHAFPESEYGRDAHLMIASAWQKAGRPQEAAAALLGFADHYPGDDSASDAMLEAANLLEASGHNDRAEACRLLYIDRHPEDVETALAILEPLARRDLSAARQDQSIVALTSSGTSQLARYLALARAHPELSSPEIEAESRFLEADVVYGTYMVLSLDQPLERSIEIKRTHLEAVLTAYRQCAEVGVPSWSQAAAFRIGQTLIAFGESLEASERPADLTENDLVAYENVLFEQAWGFYDRGEAVWSELLTHEDGDTDGWLARTRHALWERLADRFLHQPEVEYPLITASAPTRPASVSDDQTALTGDLVTVEGNPEQDRH
jgi:TolA-binding protein